MRATIVLGWILTVICVVFLLFDAVSHVLRPAPVVAAMARLDFPLSLSVQIGILELILLALYIVPRTALLGAILFTGYLGGATAIQLRSGSPVFETVFPVLFGVLLWAGLLLRDASKRGAIVRSP